VSISTDATRAYRIVVIDPADCAAPGHAVIGGDGYLVIYVSDVREAPMVIGALQPQLVITTKPIPESAGTIKEFGSDTQVFIADSCGEAGLRRIRQVASACPMRCNMDVLTLCPAANQEAPLRLLFRAVGDR